MTPEVNLYVNFALHAVLGKLREADAIMHVARDTIRGVAAELAKRCPIDPAPIYRGLLLDPDQTFRVEACFTFLSWSEDRDVALWFACPRAIISEPLMQLNPRLRGYVARLQPPWPRLLFHHRWARSLGGLAGFARAHPFMGTEGARQVEWSLHTQHEVITEPVPDILPDRVSDLEAAELEALERRLAPPWILAEEGPQR